MEPQGLGGGEKKEEQCAGLLYFTPFILKLGRGGEKRKRVAEEEGRGGSLIPYFARRGRWEPGEGGGEREMIRSLSFTG